MRDFLDRHFAHKKADLNKLAEISLRHWQKYILSRENSSGDIEIRDITRYVSNLSKKESTRTISHYLGQLVVYFKHENKKDLAFYTNQEKKKFDKEIAKAEKNHIPMRIKTFVCCTKVLN